MTNVHVSLEVLLRYVGPEGSGLSALSHWGQSWPAWVPHEWGCLALLPQPSSAAAVHFSSSSSTATVHGSHSDTVAIHSCHGNGAVLASSGAVEATGQAVPGKYMSLCPWSAGP